MILIIGSEEDRHIENVRRHLTSDSVVVDIACYPACLGLDVRLGSTIENLELTLPTGRRVELAEVNAVWCRRINPLRLHNDLSDETARLFAWSESNEALLGVWYSLHCFWMNPPPADEISQRKIRQLQAARRLGLSIPDTLVTNQPDAAREFIERHGLGRVVRKAFRNIPQAPRATALVHSPDLAAIESVRYAPVIFQDFVPLGLDLRITIVEDEIFAAAIHSDPVYEADYRIGLPSATVVPFALPLDIAAKLMALMEVFKLKYGAIDMRLTPNGDYVFFEVNPAGEYLFISHRTGQRVSAAIAASLQKHDQRRNH